MSLKYLTDSYEQDYSYIPGPGCEYEVPILYYYPEDGWFENEDGEPVSNIYDYISPDILRHFLYFKVSDLYEIKHGMFVELVFPDWFDVNEEDLIF